jgi:hypothetical protein
VEAATAAFLKTGLSANFREWMFMKKFFCEDWRKFADKL